MNSSLFEQLELLMEKWQPLLNSPDWYLTVMPELQAITHDLRRYPSESQSEFKRLLYDFFEGHLAAGDIGLGHESGVFDTERKAIDTVIIHHTSDLPGLSADRLSAIQLIRLYAPYFANPPGSDDRLKGTRIFSGHERWGKQVFWPYHWIVRMDGRSERLLTDPETGWHAGNWDINCRSVAIVLDNDYKSTKPSRVVLEAAATLIVNRYGHVPVDRVFGHREVTRNTNCPSKLFLPNSSVMGWKSDLIEELIERHRYTEAA